jgi:hypothetical protein
MMHRPHGNRPWYYSYFSTGKYKVIYQINFASLKDAYDEFSKLEEIIRKCGGILFASSKDDITLQRGGKHFVRKFKTKTNKWILISVEENVLEFKTTLDVDNLEEDDGMFAAYLCNYLASNEKVVNF